MGNGHAPGTAIGLGIAGAEVAVTDVCAVRRWTAGLAVFFFAAFFTAGFLAGFFLFGFVRTTAFLRATGFRDAGLRAAGFPFALTLPFLLRAGMVRPVVFLAAFFLADFFAFAMTASVYMVVHAGHRWSGTLG